MKALKVITAAVAAAIICTAAVSAETISTIKQVEQTALLNNLEYKTAVLEVMKAGNALEGIIKLDSSSISLSGSYGKNNNTYTEPSSGADSGFGWEASATLPVFEQLSLGASVDHDLTGTFSVNLNPLTHSNSIEQSKLTYESKLAAAEDKAAEIADTAVASYLDWASAESDYDVKIKEADVKKILYEDEKVRFDKGESTLDDVREAFSAWSESRAEFNSALTNLQAAEAELYVILNVDPADHELNSPAEADLFSLIEALEKDIEESSLSISGNYAIYSAEKASESLELELGNTWLFEPQLNVSGSLSIEQDSTVPEISATASLSFGLDDWNADERKELAAELEISRQQTTQTINTEHINLKQAQTAAETASINYEAAEVELEQAQELLSEAEFLYKLGEYSAAELEETRLQSKQSQNNLFSAAAGRYKALRELSAYAE